MILERDRGGGHRGNYGNFGEEGGRDWNRGGGSNRAGPGSFGNGAPGGGRPRQERRPITEDLPNNAPGRYYL